MHVIGNLLDACRAVVNGVHRGHDGQQGLGSTDIRSGFIAFDVLFAGLQSHTECLVVVGIFGNANDAAW